MKVNLGEPRYKSGECKQLTPDHIHRHTGFSISSLQLLDSVILKSSFVNCTDNNGHILILSSMYIV